MALSLGDNQKCDLSITETDEAGNPAGAPTTPPTWSVSDPAILNLDAVAADGMSATISAMGPLGNAQVTVTDGTLSGVLDVTVVGTQATGLTIAAAVPVHK